MNEFAHWYFQSWHGYVITIPFGILCGVFGGLLKGGIVYTLVMALFIFILYSFL